MCGVRPRFGGSITPPTIGQVLLGSGVNIEQLPLWLPFEGDQTHFAPIRNGPTPKKKLAHEVFVVVFLGFAFPPNK